MFRIEIENNQKLINLQHGVKMYCETSNNDIKSRLLYYLIENANEIDSENNFPLMYSVKKYNKELVSILAKYTDKLINSTNILGESCLSLSIHNEEIFRILIENGADINQVFYIHAYEYPILYAYKNLCSFMNLFFTGFTNINVVNGFNESLLSLALRNNDIETIRKLFNYRFDTNITYNDKPMLYYYLQDCYEINPEVLKLLLENYDVHTPYNSILPIHLGASNLNETCLQLLLDYGADINAKDGNGYTPLMYGITKYCYNRKQRVLFLLEKGSNGILQYSTETSTKDLLKNLPEISKIITKFRKTKVGKLTKPAFKNL